MHFTRGLPPGHGQGSEGDGNRKGNPMTIQCDVWLCGRIGYT